MNISIRQWVSAGDGTQLLQAAEAVAGWQARHPKSSRKELTVLLTDSPGIANISKDHIVVFVSEEPRPASLKQRVILSKPALVGSCMRRALRQIPARA